MKVFDAAAFLSFVLSLFFITTRLGSMNFKGLIPAALSSIALGIAYTSLLYSRARAVEAGPTRRRTLVAAEKAFRGVVIHIIALLVGALLFSEFAQEGSATAVPVWELKGISSGLKQRLITCTFVVCILLETAGISYYLSVRTLIRRGFMGDAFDTASTRHKQFFSSRARRPRTAKK